MEQKHAYLIIAHNNFYILERLLQLLDDDRNDIFIHIDAKVKSFDFDYFSRVCHKAVIRFSPKRNKVYWGTQSQILTEMLLFETAYAYGPYHYYHLISGVDLPIKTQNEIHAYFATQNVSFLCYAPELSKWDAQRITRYHNLFPGKGWISRRVNGRINAWQEKRGVDRLKKTGLTPYKGGNWASLPHEAVEYLLLNKKKIKRVTRFTSCADEVYKQTFLLSAGFPVDAEDFRFMVNYPGSSHPKIFTIADFDMLLAQKKFYARKFDQKIDQEIIDKISEHLQKK